MHRRKSSKEDVDDGDTYVLTPDNEPTTAPMLTTAPARLGLPQFGPGIPAHPPTVRCPPSISLNSPPHSPFRASHAWVRSKSSDPFIPPVQSPLANTFHVPLHLFEPGQVTTLQKDSEAMDEDTAKYIPATYRYSFPAHTQPSLNISLLTSNLPRITIHNPKLTFIYPHLKASPFRSGMTISLLFHSAPRAL
jgi:hypothetical protein